MSEKKEAIKDKIQHSVDEYGRKAMGYYFQDVAPAVGKMSEKMSAKSQRRWPSLIPENIGVWLVIAVIVTIVVMVMSPDRYWMIQPVIFLATFFLGHRIFSFFKKLFSKMRNLLVAYPGKHLLGKRIKLSSDIKDGRGDVSLYGDTWPIEGDDCPAGTLVKVVAVEDGSLFVERERND